MSGLIDPLAAAIQAKKPSVQQSTEGATKMSPILCSAGTRAHHAVFGGFCLAGVSERAHVASSARADWSILARAGPLLRTVAPVTAASTAASAAFALAHHSVTTGLGLASVAESLPIASALTADWTIVHRACLLWRAVPAATTTTAAAAAFALIYDPIAFRARHARVAKRAAVIAPLAADRDIFARAHTAFAARGHWSRARTRTVLDHNTSSKHGRDHGHCSRNFRE